MAIILIIERIAFHYLKEAWLEKTIGPLPLVLRGARQVGKTWLARKLGKAYGDIVEINLEKDQSTHIIFEKHFGHPN